MKYCQYNKICKHPCDKALTQAVIDAANESGDEIEIYSIDGFPECFVPFFDIGGKDE